MRILLISGSAPPQPCGIGDYTARLAEALARTPGMTVGLLTSSDARIGDHTGFDLLPVMRHWRFTALSRLWRTIRNWRPDVVHFQFPSQGYDAVLLPSLVPAIAWLLGCRVVRTWHEKMSWNGLCHWRGTPQFLLQSVVPGAFVTVRPRFDMLLHPLFRRFPWKRSYNYIPSASAIPRSNLDEEKRKNLRSRLVGDQQRLIVFFGFLYPLKGVDLVFKIANPVTDRLLLVGSSDPSSDYHRSIDRLSNSGEWKGKTSIAGFTAPEEVADILSAADAIVLPFREGAGAWNSSLHAASLQRTSIITTTRGTPGYDETLNIYFATVDDIVAMRSALDTYSGRRIDPTVSDTADEWATIAQQHVLVYQGRQCSAKIA